MKLEERLLELEKKLSTLTGHEGWVIGKCRFELMPTEKELIHDSTGSVGSAILAERVK